MYGGRRRHRARHTPHTVGTCPSIPPPSSTERNRALAGRRRIRSRSGSGKKWFVARFSTSRRFLFAVGSDGAATLKEIARHVEPRDPDNVEARAVRFYWSRLFTEFTRDDPGFQDVGPLATTTGKSVGKPRLLPKCCHTHAQPTTGKSVGKPRRRNTNPQQTCEPTTRKSVGKP